jgi:glycosyltransferase involved in cell wall biosynthesis
MEQPLVSVLITSFNREKFIGQAIDSVLKSSYQNFELIITDNCSTDNTYAIAKGYENIDSRVKVFRNEKNIGQFPNRNYAASLAKGTYLKYIDSDDMIYVYGLEILVKAATQFPSAGLIATSQLLNEIQPYPIFLTPQEAYRQCFISGGFPSVGPSFTLIKTEAFRSVNGFSIPSFAGTDTEFILKVAARYPIVKAEPGAVWYRFHEEQEINAALRNFEYELYSYSSFSNMLMSPNCPLSDQEREVALKKLRKNNIRQILKFSSKFKFSLASKLYQEVNPSVSEIIKAIAS